MNVNEEILNQVREYAGVFFTVDEIAILLDLDVVQFRREIRGKKTPQAKAYLKGKLERWPKYGGLRWNLPKKAAHRLKVLLKNIWRRWRGVNRFKILVS